MELYNGNITDPIHGLIRISDIEKWFMHQKQYSRLRWIRQNTFVYYVFPSANHTRFEHSIGVMHIASKILENAKLNYTSGDYRKNKHEVKNKAEDFEFLDINKLYDGNEKLKDVHFQELRLAALLHDIGHGPFSHKFDSFTVTKETFLTLIETDKLCGKYHAAFSELLKDLKNDEKIEHEHVSCLFILQLVGNLKEEHETKPKKFIGALKDMIEAISGERIVRLVEPKLNFGDTGKMKVNNVDLSPFYNTIISSFPLDADRMDYLLRDGTFTGVKYGVYDSSRLIMSFIPIKIENIGYLAVKESGIDACVRFIESRTHLFNIVYPHKTNVAANVMLDYIFDGYDKSIIDAEKLDQFVDFYWKNSDEYFLRDTIPNKVIKHFKDNLKEKKSRIHDELLRRRLWKRIYAERFLIETKDETKDEETDSTIKKLKEIEKKINSALNTQDEIPSKAALFLNPVFKDSKKTKLKIISRNSDKYEVVSEWRRFNQELKAMDYKVVILQIYMERTFDNSEEFINNKNGLLELIKDHIKDFEEISKKYKM